MDSATYRKTTSRKPAGKIGRQWKHYKGMLVARLGGFALRGMAWLAHRLPSAQANRFGKNLGRLLFYCTPNRRHIALNNLSQAFPGKSKVELFRVLHDCYSNLGLCIVEFLRLPALKKYEKVAEVITLEGEEHLRSALAKGRGVILLTAHFGNWELVGAGLAAAGYTLNVLARHQKDKATTSLVDSIRETAGMRVLPARSGDASRILRCLRRGEIIGFLIDQNAAREGIFVDFFGRLASTHAGAALFAIRTRAPVIPIFGIRHKDNTHTALILPEVEVIRTGNLKEDIRANTAAFTRLVEQQIRARPEMWFWLHDRWKSRPKTEKEIARD